MPPDTPVFADKGNIRILPHDQVPAALANGGRVAVEVKDDKGNLRYVPHDQMETDRQNGGTPVSAPGWFTRLLQHAGLPSTREEFENLPPRFENWPSHLEDIFTGSAPNFRLEPGSLLRGMFTPKPSQV